MNLLLTLLFFIIPSISYSQTNENKEVSKVNYASFIMYHRFGDSRYPSTNIKKEQFINHISELLKPKYNVIDIEKGINPSDKVKVEIKYASGDVKIINTLCRIDTKNELEYYKNGGILQYVLRNMI